MTFKEKFPFALHNVHVGFKQALDPRHYHTLVDAQAYADKYLREFIQFMSDNNLTFIELYNLLDDHDKEKFSLYYPECLPVSQEDLDHIENEKIQKEHEQMMDLLRAEEAAFKNRENDLPF